MTTPSGRNGANAREADVNNADAGRKNGDRRAAPPRGLDEGRSGGELNFDDNDMSHPNGKTSAEGGTWDAQGADSGRLKPPSEIQSDHIGPSDPEQGRPDGD